jgi:hypothetical protein
VSGRFCPSGIWVWPLLWVVGVPGLVILVIVWCFLLCVCWYGLGIGVCSLEKGRGLW